MRQLNPTPDHLCLTIYAMGYWMAGFWVYWNNTTRPHLRDVSTGRAQRVTTQRVLMVVEGNGGELSVFNYGDSGSCLRVRARAHGDSQPDQPDANGNRGRFATVFHRIHTGAIHRVQAVSADHRSVLGGPGSPNATDQNFQSTPRTDGTPTACYADPTASVVADPAALTGRPIRR